MHYLLETSNDSIWLKLENNGKMGCALLFIAGSAGTMFLLPILGILFLISQNGQISFGSILVFTLAWLIAGYFVRLYLWNRWGKEVFHIRRNTFTTFNDYHYFRDNEKEIIYSKINTYCVYKNEAYLINEFEDIRLDIDINEYSVIIFVLDEEKIVSHKEIPIIDIIKIAKQVHEFSPRSA
ncbi:hypothetical protein [Dysgonomonas reticulitermitis]